MAGLFTLLSLSIVMAIASFLAGILPLSISLSRSQLRLISTVGMGVLVGTSMIVIIPEGVETLYKSNSMGHNHVKRVIPTTLATVHWAHSPLSVRSSFDLDDALSRRQDFDLPGPVIPDSLIGPAPVTPSDADAVNIFGGSDDASSPEGESGSTEQDKKEDEEEAHHAWIGVALIIGFMLMFVIDKVPQLAAPPRSKPKTHDIALNQIGRRFNLSNSPNQEDDEAEGFIDNTPPVEVPKRGFATTMGLVIHAVADGIALGASSSTSHTDLSLVIFFAIMIHKAPAAFGLTSILLRQGLSKRLVRTHLVLFSLAAPTGALLTWMIAQLLGSGAGSSGSTTQWWTGVLLLFSAGTFLYVAMHAMQEMFGGHRERHDMNGHANGSLDRRDSFDQQDESKPTLKDIGAALFGMILPLFLQVRHAH